MMRFGLIAVWVGMALLHVADAAQPNIVFIFSDDHACQAISAYGSKINQTPNIDRLAASGMRFDRCLVTNSICGPSRACVLTGKYSHLNGFYDNSSRFDGSQVTFPKLLHEAGYQTAIVGKWHLVSEPTGFDFWKILPGQGRYYSPIFLTGDGRQTVPGYVTDATTYVALHWLAAERDKSKPFLLMVQHKAPHREWQPSPAHVGDHAGRQFPEPATLFDDYAGRGTAAADATMRIAQDMRMEEDLKVFDGSSRYGKQSYKLMSPDEKQAWKNAYDAENDEFRAAKPQGDELVRWKYQRYIRDYVNTVASVDDSVGQVLDYLDNAGLADNTIVIYSSDQGFYLGEHGWFDKRFIYEESLRTPLLVRWPGVTKAGDAEEKIVSNLDFAPTLLDAAGVDIPSDMQGRALRPLLAGQQPSDWRKSFYYHYYEGPPAVHTVAEHCGVVTDRYKLVHFYKLDEWELFDREQDPQELHSVYSDPSYSATRDELKLELKKLRRELGVTTNDKTNKVSG